jgi:hypothetical protein
MHFLTDILSAIWHVILFVFTFIVGVVKFLFMVLIGWWLKALISVIALMVIVSFVIYYFVNKKSSS